MDRRKKQSLRVESLARLRREVLAERAAALARITRKLERSLERLRDLELELRTAPPEAHDGRLVAFEQMRREARTYLFYLKVQREVNGLHDGDRLDVEYPIPGPPSRRAGPREPRHRRPSADRIPVG